MKIQEKCLPCIVNQVLKVANMVGLTDKDELLKKVFVYLSKADFKQATTPELIGDIFEILKQETGNDDPYKETRDHYNSMFLDLIPTYEQAINEADEPFLMAIKYAIIGNIIDFNPIHNTLLSDIENCFAMANTETLAIDDSKQLMEDVQHARTVLYLGDNCGEICLDKILVKKLKELNPFCDIYFATRGSAVVNDSIEEDAYFVGMDTYASILSNGDHSLGTVLHKTSKEFQNIYHKADIIIAKGQANYECLSNEKRNIYFLLMTKCVVIADDIGVAEKKMICKKQQ
ncbi:MAG: ARMT1-like domain-containing protein [Clostridiales bacterium]|nr:ARMT1-like domain-containing protein [Clostridiales bacterium]